MTEQKRPGDQMWLVTWKDRDTGKEESARVRGGNPATHIAVVLRQGHKDAKAEKVDD